MRLTAAARAEMLRHARAEAPRECCGILLAEPDRPGLATRVVRSANIEPDRPERRYLLDHAAHLEAVELEIADEATIVAYYHSHPAGPARPSRSDREQALEDTVYVIVGLADSRVAAWRLDGPEFVEERLTTDNSEAQPA